MSSNSSSNSDRSSPNPGTSPDTTVPIREPSTLITPSGPKTEDDILTQYMKLKAITVHIGENKNGWGPLYTAPYVSNRNKRKKVEASLSGGSPVVKMKEDKNKNGEK